MQYLEKEADFLKKFRIQRAQGKLPYDLKKDQKLEIIKEIVTLAKRTDANCPSVTALCSIAEVSRVGYYNWLDTEEARKVKEEQDQNDFDLILEAYKKHGYSKGARSIHMVLLYFDKSIIMNTKNSPFYEEIRSSLPYSPSQPIPHRLKGKYA